MTPVCCKINKYWDFQPFMAVEDSWQTSCMAMITALSTTSQLIVQLSRHGWQTRHWSWRCCWREAQGPRRTFFVMSSSGSAHIVYIGCPPAEKNMPAWLFVSPSCCQPLLLMLMASHCLPLWWQLSSLELGLGWRGSWITHPRFLECRGITF